MLPDDSTKKRTAAGRVCGMVSACHVGVHASSVVKCVDCSVFGVVPHAARSATAAQTVMMCFISGGISVCYDFGYKGTNKIVTPP